MLFPIISFLMSGSVHRTVARTKRNGIFVAVAVVLVLTAYVFVLVAAAVWLGTAYGAVGAALLIAAGALLLAIILLVVMAILNAQERRRARESRAALESVAIVGLELIRSQPLLAAAVAGAFLLSALTGSRKEHD
jgi:chromate transport protein ChrA